MLCYFIFTYKDDAGLSKNSCIIKGHKISNSYHACLILNVRPFCLIRISFEHKIAGTSSNLLAARPMLDHRRSSHTGIPMQRRTSQSLYQPPGHQRNVGPRRTSNTANIGGGGVNRVRDGAVASGTTSPRFAYGGGTYENGNNLLLIPTRGRSRGASLPGTMDNVDQEEIYRLRNFATSGKGKVINRGDSLKSRSNLSINSAASR